MNENIKWQRNLVVLWLGVFLTCASYTMVIPFLPVYLLKELMLTQEETKLWSGAIIGVTFVLCGLMAPYWGARGDVTGQKKNAFRAGIGISVCYFLSAMVTSPLQLFGVRALVGMVCGFVPACMTMASTTLPTEKTGWGMGIMQTGLASGTVLGPLIGGALSKFFSMRASFVAAGVGVAIATVAIHYLVTEKVCVTQLKERTDLRTILSQLWSTVHAPRLIEIMGLYALLRAAYLIVQPLLALHVHTVMGGATEAGWVSGIILSLAGFAGIIGAPFWGKKGQQYGFARILSFAMVTAGAMNMAQLIIPADLFSFSALYFVHGLFLAGATPNLASIMVEHTPEQIRGKAFGLTTGADQLGGAIGPLIGGSLGLLLPMQEIMALSGLVLILGAWFVSRRFMRVEGS